MPPLFFFGSLMDPELLSVVLDRPLPADALTPAWLEGWARVRATDETYPLLVPSVDARIDGVLFEPRAGDLDRVRFFEDYDYDLKPCMPMLKDGTAVSARACFAEDRLAASTETWTLERWRVDGKAELMFLARRYMACYGRMDVEAAEAVWVEAKSAWAAGAADTDTDTDTD